MSSDYTPKSFRISRLDWDSEFWSLNVGRIDATEDGVGVYDHIESATAALDTENFDVAYLLIDLGQWRLLREAVVAGWAPVDLRITLQRQTASAPLMPEGVRPAEAKDEPALREIAASAHTGTRFWTDDRFDRRLCKDLYSQWISNDLAGRSDVVLVCGPPSAPAGYISVTIDDDKASIGLVAVDQAHRGKRIGRTLVEAGVVWAGDNGTSLVDVVTQGTNRAALSLYESAGFRVVSHEIWLHRWRD